MFISYFKNGVKQTVPDADADVMQVIGSIKKGQFAELIEKVRAESDKKKRNELKAGLPYVTFSGLFKKRVADGLKTHSGLICIDVDDLADADYARQREALTKDPYSFCVFRSPSGNGLKVLVKIDGSLHLKAFLQLEAYYAEKYQVTIDKSGKDVTRATFLSFDPDTYTNTGSEFFPVDAMFDVDFETGEIIEIIEPRVRTREHELDKLTVALAVAEEVVKRGIDLTASYEEWVKVGMGVSELGEEGREIYHKLSKVHTGYDEKATDQKYTDFLKNARNKNTATFFRMAKDNGIDLKEIYRSLRGTLKQETAQKMEKAGLSPIQLSSMLIAMAQMGEKEKWVDHLVIATGATEDITKTWVDEIPLVAVADYDYLWKGVSKTELADEIRNVLNEHRPKEVTLLYGTDAMHCKYDEDRDLYRKPKMIENQVVQFRSVLQPFMDDENRPVQNVYWAYLKSHLMSLGRTVFDIQALPNMKKKTLMEGIKGSQLDTDYVIKLKVTEIKENKLAVHLGNTDVGRFYDVYAESADIGSKQFVWRNALHYYNRIENKIIRLHHLDSENYIWIGDTTVKIVWKQLNGGMMVRDVKKFSHTELKRIYNESFLKDLERVDGFTFWPDNKKFDQIVEVKQGKHHFRYYNMYQPLLHQPLDGKCEVTMAFLQHLFPGAADQVGMPLAIALDWLTLLYQNPRQTLPIIGLISKEQQTGKTTFMDWLRAWLGSNSANMGIEDYLSKFNKHASFKLLVCIDEFEESALEKKTAKAKFKKQATEKNSLVELKGIDKEEIPNYCKVVFATNSEKPLNLELEDMNRFWIQPVQRIKAGQRDKDLLDKMIKEIPAFLHFLLHRKVLHEGKSRAWFDPELFNTEYFRKIVSLTKPLYFDDIENYVRSLFLDFRVASVRINPAVLLEAMPKTKYPISEKQVKEVFQEHGYDKMNPDDSGVMEVPTEWIKRDNTYDIKYYASKIGNNKPRGRYYLLKAQDWLTDEEMEQYKTPIEQMWAKWNDDRFNPLEEMMANSEKNEPWFKKPDEVPEWIGK